MPALFGPPLSAAIAPLALSPLAAIGDAAAAAAGAGGGGGPGALGAEAVRLVAELRCARPLTAHGEARRVLGGL